MKSTISRNKTIEKRLVINNNQEIEGMSISISGKVGFKQGTFFEDKYIRITKMPSYLTNIRYLKDP